MNRARLPILLFAAIAIALSACVPTTTDTTTASPPVPKASAVVKAPTASTYSFSTNSELRGVLQSIDRRCSQQYQSNRQGSSTMARILGGDVGTLIASAAKSSADAQLRECRSEYDRVAAAGRQRGLTADPRREARDAENRAAAAVLTAVLSAPTQAATSTGGSDCGSHISRDACNHRRLEEQYHNSPLHRSPLD